MICSGHSSLSRIPDGRRNDACRRLRAGGPHCRAADVRGTRCAANDPGSNSGMNLLRAMIAPLAGGRRFFCTVLWSESHRESLAMIARDEADIAAIDCVTFEQLRTLEPALVAAVRVIGWSDASPGLPLVTAAGPDDRTLAALRAALADIVADTTLAPALDALLIDGFDVLSLDSCQKCGRARTPRRRPWLFRAGVKPRLLLDRVTIHRFQPLISFSRAVHGRFLAPRRCPDQGYQRRTHEAEHGGDPASSPLQPLSHPGGLSARRRHGRTGEGLHRAGI